MLVDLQKFEFNNYDANAFRCRLQQCSPIHYLSFRHREDTFGHSPLKMVTHPKKSEKTGILPAFMSGLPPKPTVCYPEKLSSLLAASHGRQPAFE